MSATSAPGSTVRTSAVITPWTSTGGGADLGVHVSAQVPARVRRHPVPEHVGLRDDAHEPVVVVGPYRYVRNPMYLAVLAIVLGQALLSGSWGTVVYGGTVLLAVVLFVLG